LVVAKACEQIRARIAEGQTGRIEAYAENVPQGLPSSAVADMEQGKPSMLSGSGRKDVTAFAFGAHFVELGVHRLTREVRVRRVVSAFAAGTIVNELAAHSQFMGGTIWGLSAALHEETEIDVKAARYVNNNLADYLVPVNADIPDIEIIMVPETDERVNALGIKGIGEIGIVGMNAAVANAVFNATGVRIRALPIRAEKLLQGLA
jgi:xanthine dehydrogenase YagR molybdenum-binding subunit